MADEYQAPTTTVAKAAARGKSRLDDAESAAMNPTPQVAAQTAPNSPPSPAPSSPSTPPNLLPANPSIEKPSLFKRIKSAVGLKDGGEVPSPDQMEYGGGDDYKHGGKVRGPSMPADSVPANLTGGEYVLPRDTTQAIGSSKLDRIVDKTHNPANALPSTSMHAAGSRGMK